MDGKKMSVLKYYIGLVDSDIQMGLVHGQHSQDMILEQNFPT